MPTRAGARRVGRPKRAVESPASDVANTDPTHSPLPRLQKPQLPKLKGTPSSRRQYTYGAGEEPLPARAGHRMRHDEELDLGTAVGNLLQLQEEEDTRERMPPPPPPPPPPAARDEDELSAEAPVTANGRRQASRLGSVPDDLAPNVFDALGGVRNERPPPITDDASLRSFATESDIFGDAIISSPPRLPPPIPELQALSNPQERPSRRRTARDVITSNAPPEPVQTRPRGPSSRAGLEAPDMLPQPETHIARQEPRKSRREARATEPTRPPIPRLPPPQNKVKLVPSGKRPWASDYSEQDDEMQNSIRMADDEFEYRGARAEPQSPWQKGWIRIKNYSPFRRRQSIDDDDDETEEDESSDSVIHAPLRAPTREQVHEPPPQPREWPRFLTLSVYTDAIRQCIHYINEQVTFMLIRVGDWAQSVIQGVAKVNPWLAVLVLFLAIAGSWLALSERADTPWNISDRLGQIHVPSLPSFSLPLPSWGKQGGLIDLDDEALQNLSRDVREMLSNMNHEYAHVADASRLQASEIKAIKDSLPDMVYMEKKGGKPHVPESFWAPFRSRFMEDTTVLRHFVSGTLKDSAFTAQLTKGIKATEDRLERKFSDQWAQWVADNNDKVNSGKPPPSNGMLVTKDEFTRHLRDFTNNRHDVRAALDDIKPTVQAFVREAVKEATQSQVSMAQVMTVVTEIVRKELAGIRLDRHAQGEMSRNWELLRRNVNWFNPAAGATINAVQSSKTWKPLPENKKKPKGSSGSGGFWSILTADPPETMVALEPWFEEGDCWCATHDIDARQKPHGAKLVVQLGQLIIPQHIVLEHIHPSATTDPGARPKVIEVYGNYHYDDALRERVLRFAHERGLRPDTTTPDEARDHDMSLLGRQFVMIGRFEYTEGPGGDGVHVHRLSEQLDVLGAATDEVAIRVVANDGNQDHTCFYRVRMFGQRGE